MSKVIVVTSGKGGVGKTTSTAALGAALAQMGKNVVVIDFDVGLRNLDLVMGAERRVVFDLINVVQGDAKLNQALIRDKRCDTLHLLPASQTRDKDALTVEGVTRVIAECRERFDFVLCDSPAGIEKGAQLAMYEADAAVIVTNPEVSSVRDSDRIIGLLDSKTRRVENGERMEKHLLLTRYDAARAAALRDAQGRGRAGDPEHPAARHHPRIRGSAALLEHGRARDAAGAAELAGPRLCRGRAAARGRGARGHRAGRQDRHLRQTVSPEGRMSWLARFRKHNSAPVARDRLQILLAHERTADGRGDSRDLIAVLQEEIMAVIAKHVAIDRDKVQIKLDRDGGVSTLEIDVEMPENAPAAAARN